MAVDADVDVVARTLIGEARGCRMLDMLAVGAVIRERVLRPGWWGRSWQGVCRAKAQFSCWEDRNLKVMLHAEIEAPDIWPLAWRVADLVVHGMRDRDIEDMFHTQGPYPSHYHDRSINAPASWGVCEVVPTVWASKFVFYRGLAGTPKRRG